MAIGKLLDYSAQSKSIDLKAVKAAGYEGVFRYVCLSDVSLPGKLLRPAERDAILAAGLDIGLHGEDEAGAVFKGYSRGLEQGKQWSDYARTVLGAPKGMTIVPAIDSNTGGYVKVVDDYLRGVDDGLAGYYEMGTYGSSLVIGGAHKAGRGTSCYVMTNAWGPDDPPTFCHIHQHGGDPRFGSVDFNDVLIRPYGSWKQTLSGVDMPISDAEFSKIADIMTSLEVRNMVKNQVTAVLHDLTHPNSIDSVNTNIDAEAASLAGKIADVKSVLATAVTAIAGANNAQTADLTAKLGSTQTALEGKISGISDKIGDNSSLLNAIDQLRTALATFEGAVAPQYSGTVSLTPTPVSPTP